MTEFSDILIAAFLVISGIFGFVGSYGLIKLPDPMMRLHAPTNAATVGIGAVLIASMIQSVAFEGFFSFREVMIALFLFLTAPITANFIAKAHIHRHARRRDLPDPGPDSSWAALTVDEDDETAS